ncbi:MAG TPA: uracil-xanthine permease family protein [Desulfovibrio sp.]|jgi:uracil permease|uniref:uracil-xanthine permease family protein n=1 Tax=Desulfovibrio TaxID=872 RepID=UPI0004217260|nr:MULTISPECIES: uracil-xanthine permease family protein [Desulfovibrio]MDY0304953.1 uracil-xanthine permease family protein [Desulfovibrionaceae bacterium]HMM39509.1 uracil-xanthine permease family protein [Desulfovibrio sp.]
MSAVRQPTDYVFRLKDAVLGAQMLFVAFGALVLVPLLTGLNPNVALFTAGAGTLLFQVITKGKVPVFLASSFAFIAPIIYGVQTWGIPATLSGLAAAGLVYVLLAAVIKLRGVQMLHRILPPIVTGPVIMVIGLILAPVAVNMALGKTGDGSAVLVPRDTAMIVSMLSLLATIAVSMLAKGWLRLLPILSGIVVGYAASLAFGLVDFSRMLAAPWLAVPDFVFPEFKLEAVLFIVPVAIAPAIEHFGDVLAIGSIARKDYIKDPGVHRTLLGDGLATSLASLLGGPPNTTYSEVSGAVALIKVFNPAIMTWAAITAMLLAFVGKLGAFLGTIPVPVMGGIMVLLFGAIMVVGINTLVRAGQDLMEPRNMVIVALIVIFGVGGMSFGAGEFKLEGIGLAGITGVVLNLLLPEGKRQS